MYRTISNISVTHALRRPIWSRGLTTCPFNLVILTVYLSFFPNINLSVNYEGMYYTLYLLFKQSLFGPTYTTGFRYVRIWSCNTRACTPEYIWTIWGFDFDHRFYWYYVFMFLSPSVVWLTRWQRLKTSLQVRCYTTLLWSLLVYFPLISISNNSNCMVIWDFIYVQCPIYMSKTKLSRASSSMILI